MPEPSPQDQVRAPIPSHHGNSRLMGALAAAVALALMAVALTTLSVSAASPTTKSSSASAPRRAGALTTPSTAATHDRVLVVGDSLTAGSSDQVNAALTTAGTDPAIAAISGTTIEYWAQRMADLIAWLKPTSVIIELGTNDCNGAGTACSLASTIDELVGAIPEATPISWLNVQEQPSYPTYARSVNAQLREAATRHPNMTIVNMSALFANHPEWHIVDGLHFNTSGAEQLGTLMARAVRPTT